MAGTFTSTGAYSNLTRLELEQLRRGDFLAGGKALTIGDSALLPEGIVGKGSVNAEVFYSNSSIMLKEVLSVLPPSKPGDFLQKNLNIYPTGSESAEWYGPTEISFGGEFDTPTAATQAVGTFTDSAANFIADGVLAGDLILIEMPADGNKVGVVLTVDSAIQITATNITGGSWPTAAVNWYQIVRPGAVQLFAVPGSGPVGQEQTFLFVTPGSTLHSTVGPTTDAINLDRVQNLVSSRYALDTTVDRADAVYVSPAPHTTLSGLGYRVVLYPDNGSGTAPDLSSPITSLNPLIDGAIPADDQRMTIDYAAGTIRFSCAPTLTGQIKVPGGVNATTGRLNLYAVFWAIDKRSTVSTTYTNSSARGLYVPNENGTTPNGFAALRNNGVSWVFTNQRIPLVGQPEIVLSGNAVGNRLVKTLGVDSAAESIVKKLNATVFSCGDNVKSFGDFNGATALEQAIAYWIGTASLNNSLTIYLKGGDYTLGNSNFNVPAGKEVIIRGEGREATRILFDGGSSITTCIGVNAGSRIHLADLAIRYGAGGYLSAQGSVSADNCLFEEISLSYSNATPYKAATTGPFPFLGLFTNCEFNNDLSHPFTGAPRAAVSIYASGTSMKGFVFRNCTMRSATAGGTVVHVTTFGAGSLAATVSDLAFESCVIDLPAVDTTSATAIATPAGVLSVDPDLSLDMLTVDKVRFIDCTVSVVDNTRNNTVLLHLMPLPFDAVNTTTERAIIGTVEISGGTWSVPINRGTDFVPFYLQCLNPKVKNVRFTGGGQETLAFNTSPGFRGNGFYTDTQRIAMRGSTANCPTGQSRWATISASGNAILNGYTLQTGMTIQNVDFSNFHRKAGPPGVLMVVGPDIKSGGANVDGIHVRGIPGATGVTNLIDSWMTFVPGGNVATNRGTNGTFRNITFSAETITPATTDTWANRGFMRVVPEGRMSFEDIILIPTKQSTMDGPDGIASPAINLSYPLGGDTTATPGGPIIFNRVHIENWTSGIIWAQNPTTVHPIGPFHIQALHHTCSHAGTGSNNNSILFNQGAAAASGYTIQGITIEDCRIINTGYPVGRVQGGSIFLQSSTWGRNFPCVLRNNFVYDEWVSAAFPASVYQIAVMSFDVAASTPTFNIVGNTTTRANTSFPLGLAGLIRLQQGVSGALTTNTKYGGTSALYTNAQTGHSIVDTDDFLFANTFDMECNIAQLATA